MTWARAATTYLWMVSILLLPGGVGWSKFMVSRILPDLRCPVGEVAYREGLSLLTDEKWAEAASSFDAAVSQQSNPSVKCYGLILAACAHYCARRGFGPVLKRLDNAEVLLANANELEGGAETIALLRSSAHLELKQYQDAFSVSSRALTAFPDSKSTEHLLAVFRRAVEAGGFRTKAEDVLRPLLPHLPTDGTKAVVLWDLWSNWHNAGQDAKGFPYLQRLLKEYPDSPQAAVGRKWLALTHQTLPTGGGKATRIFIVALAGVVVVLLAGGALVWHRRRSPGFTLLELLVVIAIIALLAGIMLPVFAKAREKGRQTVCIVNLRQFGLAVQMYLDYWEETFPACHAGTAGPGASEEMLGEPWFDRICAIGGTKPLERCPSDPADLPVSYVVNGYFMFATPLVQAENPAGTILLAERADDWMPGMCYMYHPWLGEEEIAMKIAPGRHNEMSNYLFLDGHTKALAFDLTLRPENLHDLE